MSLKDKLGNIIDKTLLYGAIGLLGLTIGSEITEYKYKKLIESQRSQIQTQENSIILYELNRNLLEREGTAFQNYLFSRKENERDEFYKYLELELITFEENIKETEKKLKNPSSKEQEFLKSLKDCYQGMLEFLNAYKETEKELRLLEKKCEQLGETGKKLELKHKKFMEEAEEAQKRVEQDMEERRKRRQSIEDELKDYELRIRNSDTNKDGIIDDDEFKQFLRESDN